MTEPGARYSLDRIRTNITDGGDHYILNGTKLFVENAHSSDYILCVASTASVLPTDEALNILLVDRKSPGIQITALDTLAYDKQSEVVFKNVRVPRENLIVSDRHAIKALEKLQEQAAVAKCSELLGIIQTAFLMSVSYAKERTQFGRPIGSFQAVQHHCANMAVDVDGARFITYKAAWKLAEFQSAGMEASMAKAWTIDAARKVTTLGHQIHGAISFCDEHDLHLYYRKATAGEIAFGDSGHHLEKVAAQLGL